MEGSEDGTLPRHNEPKLTDLNEFGHWRRSRLAILRRSAAGFIIETPDGRARVYDSRHNDMKLSLRRLLDDQAQSAQLAIRFDWRARALLPNGTSTASQEIVQAGTLGRRNASI